MTNHVAIATERYRKACNVTEYYKYIGFILRRRLDHIECTTEILSKYLHGVLIKLIGEYLTCEDVPTDDITLYYYPKNTNCMCIIL
jgi:hypothetical protein